MKKFMFTIAFLMVLVLAVISTFTGCDENKINPEIKNEIASRPSVAQEVSVIRSELEAKLMEFRQHRKTSTESIIVWYRSKARAESQLAWAEHRKDKKETLRWLGIINKMSLERANWEVAEAEAIFAMKQELARQAKWSRERPGWR